MKGTSFPVELHDELLRRTDKLHLVYRPAQNQIQYFNPAFETLLSQKAETLLSDPSLALDVVHKDDLEYLKNVLALLPSEKNVRNIEFRIVVKDNGIRWLRAEAYHVSSASGDVIITSALDITDEKEYGANLNKFNEKKNTILEILSHDLSGPLGNITMCCSLLQQHTKDYNNKDVEELLEKISRNSRNALELITDFLNEEFLESSETVLNKDRIDIVKKISVMIDQFKTSEPLIRKNYHFHPDSESLFVTVDEVKFMQVLQNLISNAMKFTKDDGVITVKLKDDKEKFLMTVEDNGIGIPAHLQHDLFDKFTKARRPGLKGERSVGLGMSIIKKIIDWHNGKIWFKSEEGKGTTFYVEIPKEN